MEFNDFAVTCKLISLHAGNIRVTWSQDWDVSYTSIDVQKDDSYTRQGRVAA